MIDFSQPELWIRIWADDTWAVLEDIREGEYDWKSDDYFDVDMYDFDEFNKLPISLAHEIVLEVMGESGW